MKLGTNELKLATHELSCMALKQENVSSENSGGSHVGMSGRRGKLLQVLVVQNSHVFGTMWKRNAFLFQIAQNSKTSFNGRSHECKGISGMRLEHFEDGTTAVHLTA